MKILIVSKCPTHPTNAGNRWGILAQAQILQKLGNEIHFLYINELPMRMNSTPYLKDLEETSKYWGNRFHLFTVSKVTKLCFNIKKYIDKYFFDDYFNVDEVYPNGLSSYVSKLQAKDHFDICIVNYVYLTKLFTKVKFPKTAVFTHDCMSYKNLMVNEPCRTMNAHQEAIALQRCQHIFAVQDEEMAYFHLLSPKSKVYNIYSKYDYHPQDIVNNHNIVFLSGGNPYNVHGIQWFIKEIWPLIIKRFSDAQLIIGGSICKVIKDIEGIPGITLYGYVDVPADFYAQADVAINPVFQGTGLKIKTFEAISFDKVTLVHPHSMAGVFRKEEAPLLASDNPEEWVKILEKVWNSTEFIKQHKLQNKRFLKEMNEFIVNEYKRFLDA